MGQKYARHDAHSKELPPLPTQQPVWLQKAPDVNLWQVATEISTPGESLPGHVDLPQMVPNTSNMG